MNVFILSDLEGIPGVTSIEQMDVTTDGYQIAKKCLTESINRTAQYCFEAGAEKVYYMDGHAGPAQHNVIDEELLPQLICVTHSSWIDMIINKEVDCVIELGSHARAGTINGFLDHTRSSREVFTHKINGREFGELALHAAFCGEYDVPVIACIGDKTACIQAREYIPQIHIAPVKKAIGRNKAVEIEDPYALIEKTVKEALADYQNIEPFRVASPVVVEMIYYRTDMCEAALAKCGSEVIRTDARTLVKVINSAARYQDLSM